MTIQVLGFDDCPHTTPFRKRVQDAARRLHAAEAVQYIDQEQLPASDLRRGYPAPTVLVNGRDLFGLSEPTSPALGCRMYPGGLPSVDQIETRLRERLGSVGESP